MPKISIATDATRGAAFAAVAEKGGQTLARTPEARVGPERVWVRCAAGHEWCPQLGQLVRGQWCRACSGRAPLTLDMMCEMAVARGGRCLADVYTNSTTALLWECARGHRWLASAYNVRHGNGWCRVCRDTDKDTLASDSRSESEGSEPEQKTACPHLRPTAMDKGESEEASSPERSAAATPAAVSAAVSVPERRGRPPLTIEMMHELAAARGGRCRSETYKNCTALLSWECARGHHWRAPASYVRNRGTWCERCKITTVEIIRAIMDDGFCDKKSRKMPSVCPLKEPQLTNGPGLRITFDDVPNVLFCIPFRMGPLEILNGHGYLHTAIRPPRDS